MSNSRFSWQQWLADLPLRRKLMLITMTIVLLTTLGSLAFLRYQSERSRHADFIQQALARTRMAAEYAAAPITFDDSKGARDMLDKLSQQSDVSYAAMYDMRQRLFSHVGSAYQRPIPIGGTQEYLQDDTLLHVREPIRHHGVVGELRVGYRLDGLEHSSGRELHFLLGLLTVVITISYGLSLWLQRIISGPLLALEEHARRLASSDDLNVRLDPPGNDEIGSLYRAFNSLMQRVGQREEDIMALNRSLEAKVAERTHDLEQARDHADSANRSKSEFLANMSHEIRTPINAINGFTALALRTRLDSKQQSYLDKIQVAAQGLLRIINDLLDFSKIEAGHLDMESISLDLHEVIDSTIAHCGNLAERKGLELLVTLAPDVPTRLIGDPLRLGQVLINLCNNAVKFTERGEIELRVVVEARQGQQVQLHFSVRDTGIGLTSEQSARLFHAFSQADASTTRRFGGTGLGLVISERIVSMMQGRIWLESRSGLGSTFHFVVTLEEDPTPAPSHYHDYTLQRRGQRALVVDDNANARQILLSQLDMLGMDAHAVESGEAAIRELQQASAQGQPYPLVLMDWKMPGLDGLAATRVIRADPAISRTPVIIMVTAFGREQAMSAPDHREMLDGVLLKPVTPALLAATLNRSIPGGDLAPAAMTPSHSKRQGLAGTRLLLVEDNPINQTLATELLEQEGANVITAANGAIALQLLETLSYERFDAILMDLQMPEMDGYTATRMIRQHADGKTIPILAMTAHAMIEEKARCLALGMNDHIAKPIDPELLINTLRKWIAPEKISAAQAITPTGIHATHAEPVTLPASLPGLDLQAALRRCNGNPALLRDLLRQFAQHYADAPKQIGQAIASQHLSDARFLSHTIKGAAANLGAPDLATAAAELNSALGRPFVGDCSAMLQVFGLAHQIVMRSIAQLGDETNPTVHDDIEPIHLSTLAKQLIETLRQRLDANHTDAEQVLARLEEALGLPAPPWLARLHTAVHALDYPQALALIRTLRPA